MVVGFGGARDREVLRGWGMARTLYFRQCCDHTPGLIETDGSTSQ